MRHFLAGMAFTFAAALAAGIAVAALGLAPVNADQAPTAIEIRILGVALRSALARQAVGVDPSRPPSTEGLANGAEIYQEMCARCHGEPGKPPSPLGASFYPPAPPLPGHRTDWSDRELFWLIKHGIRNTAMPAWGRLLSDDDVRDVAAVVKRFDAK